LSKQGLGAYEIARELLEKKGPLSKDRWDDAVNLFGMDGALGLLHYIGVYSSISILVNGLGRSIQLLYALRGQLEIFSMP